MTHLAPHLLLRAYPGPSRTAEILGFAGYVVSKLDDDALALGLTRAAHIDGIVTELSALDTIRLGRELATRQSARDLVFVAISVAPDAIRRSLPHAIVLTPREMEDDLVSAVDLAIAARQMRTA